MRLPKALFGLQFAAGCHLRAYPQLKKERSFFCKGGRQLV